MRKIYSYVVLFFTGVFCLVLELGGARMLAPFFGGSIYVWSSTISVTLGSLALGYYLGGKAADRRPQPNLFFGLVTVIGLVSLLLIKFNRPLLVLSDRFGYQAGPLVASLLLFALPLVLLGALSPVLIRIEAKDPASAGQSAGRIFALTTLGSLCGALVTGFVLVPNFSLARVFTVSAVLVALLGLAGLRRRSRPLTAALVLFLVAVAFLPVVRVEDGKDIAVLATRQSFYGDLKVIESNGVRALIVNGGAQTVTVDGQESDYIQGLAGALSPLDGDGTDGTKAVLVLGLGGGGLARAIPAVWAVDYVEIDPNAADLARQYFGFREDGNDAVIITDARRYLRETDRRYDAIVVDLYNGVQVPVHFHTRESLALLRDRLKPNGYVLSNLVGAPDDELVRTLVATLRAVFPQVMVTAMREGYGNLLVYAFPEARPERGEVVAGGESVNSGLIWQEVAVDTASVEAVTDDRNPLELLSAAGIDRYLENIHGVLGNNVFFAI